MQADELILTADLVVQHMAFVITSSFTTFGGSVYKLTMGIPTGTNMAPEEKVTVCTRLCWKMTKDDASATL